MEHGVVPLYFHFNLVIQTMYSIKSISISYNAIILPEELFTMVHSTQHYIACAEHLLTTMCR